VVLDGRVSYVDDTHASRVLEELADGRGFSGVTEVVDGTEVDGRKGVDGGTEFTEVTAGSDGTGPDQEEQDQ